MMRKVGVQFGMMVLLSMVMASNMALAQGMDDIAQGTSYALAKLGYFMPNGDEEGLEDFDNTFDFGAAYGYFVYDAVSVEIGMEYYSVDAEESETFGYYTAKSEKSVSVTAIPITGKYHYPLTN